MKKIRVGARGQKILFEWCKMPMTREAFAKALARQTVGVLHDQDTYRSLGSVARAATPRLDAQRSLTNQPTKLADARQTGPTRNGGTKGADEWTSNVTMDPNVWGPPLWSLLFLLCQHPRADDTPKILKLLELLTQIMPCSHCRRSYILYRQTNDPRKYVSNSNNKDPCRRWLWAIHDMVNQKLGKICISYDKLVIKQNVYTRFIDDFMVADVFCFLALAASDEWLHPTKNIRPEEAERKKRVAAFITLSLQLLRDKRMNRGVWKAFASTTWTSDNLFATLLRAKNVLLESHELELQTWDSFTLQYSQCIV